MFNVQRNSLDTGINIGNKQEVGKKKDFIWARGDRWLASPFYANDVTSSQNMGGEEVYFTK